MFREWERLQLRDCDYKNHRIFTLRSFHKELVPVSIRLKTTLQAEKAKKMNRTAEKQLLQVAIKSMSSILDNNTKQRELYRSKLVSILSTTNFRKCQVLIEKVGEFRFNKVNNRQLNKFNNLVCKKEGNITWETSQSTRVIDSVTEGFVQSGAESFGGALWVDFVGHHPYPLLCVLLHFCKWGNVVPMIIFLCLVWALL